VQCPGGGETQEKRVRGSLKKKKARTGNVCLANEPHRRKSVPHHKGGKAQTVIRGRGIIIVGGSIAPPSVCNEKKEGVGGGEEHFF